MPVALLQQKGRGLALNRGNFLPQTGGDSGRLLFILQLDSAAGVCQSGQIFPGFQKAAALRPGHHRQIFSAGFVQVIPHAEPAQGTAPVAFPVGIVLPEHFLIHGKGLVKFARSAQIVAAVVGGGVLGVHGQGHNAAAAAAGAQGVVREGGYAPAAVFAFQNGHALTAFYAYNMLSLYG